MATVPTLDRNALKSNEVTIVTLIALAFVVNIVWPLVVLAAVLAVAAARPEWSLLRAGYQRIVLGLGVVRPRVVPGEFAPRRFTQGVAAALLVFSAAALWVGLPLVGWALAWLVALLAGLSLFTGFCAGCFVYYQLRRLGLLGKREKA